MRRSKAEIYLHFVWTTWRREPTLVPEMESSIYRCLQQQCQAMGCAVLAVGGMPDHIHLALKVPTTLSTAHIMKQVKGTTSAFGRDHFATGFFGWQDNYAVFSFSPRDRDQVVAYIQNQKRHHAEGRLWPETEELGDYEIEDPRIQRGHRNV